MERNEVVTRCNPICVCASCTTVLVMRLQLGEIEAAVAQLDLHGEAAGIADALDRRRREDDDARLLITAKARLNCSNSERRSSPLPRSLQSLSTT